MPIVTFDAVLVRPESARASAYLRIPLDIQTAFGKKGQIKVKGSINGHPYRGSAMPEGNGTHFLAVNKAMRDAIGAHAGATVHVVMEPDEAARTVSIPADLQMALEASQHAGARFAALPYSHQKEYVDWIEGAKKAETRLRRLQTVMERLQQSEKPEES